VKFAFLIFHLSYLFNVTWAWKEVKRGTKRDKKRGRGEKGREVEINKGKHNIIKQRALEWRRREGGEGWRIMGREGEANKERLFFFFTWINSLPWCKSDHETLRSSSRISRADCAFDANISNEPEFFKIGTAKKK
jgi:hypothetical protein